MAESDPKKEIEEPYELPEGWLWATLGEICSKPQYGWTASADPNGDGLKLLRTTDISPGNINWPTVPACSKLPDDIDKYKLKPGDIVVSRAGSVGISIELTECPNAIFASYLIRFNAMSPIPPRYISLFLKTPSYWSSIVDNTAGIAIPNVNATKLANLKIPLSPFPEQHRIVAKLETLLAQVNRSKDHLAKVPPLIKRFRQSVLAAACSGRMTEDWRRVHPDVEPASELLNRIQKERIRRYEEECRKAELEGRRKPKKPKNLEPQVVDTDGLPELPEWWVWTRLGLIIDSMKNGLYKPIEYYGSGVPCLRMYNIEDGRIVWKDIKKMELTNEEINEYKLLPNDLLVNRVNSRELVGKTAIFPPAMGDVVYESKNIRLRLIEIAASPKYINFLFMTRIIRDQIELKAKQTVGMATISQSQIENWIIPSPPLFEQQIVAERVEKLFHFADEVEQRVAKATAHTEHLTQSILARAFRGELVPQDPSDEHASVMLERIKQERAKNEMEKKTGKRKTKTLLDYC
jgi:type I restriction enzyme S subunit